MVRRNFTVDTLLEMKDAGLIAASAAALVATVAKVIDLGAGMVEGNIVLDVTAIEIATGDESYDIVLQLSSDSDFGTDTNIVDQCDMHLGASGTKRTDSNADDVIGRYIVPFTNERGGTVLRYARLYTVVAGTIATGINYTGRMSKN